MHRQATALVLVPLDLSLPCLVVAAAAAPPLGAHAVPLCLQLVVVVGPVNPVLLERLSALPPTALVVQAAALLHHWPAPAQSAARTNHSHQHLRLLALPVPECM